jgi:hypothetical protein
MKRSRCEINFNWKRYLFGRLDIQQSVTVKKKFEGRRDGGEHTIWESHFHVVPRGLGEPVLVPPVNNDIVPVRLVPKYHLKDQNIMDENRCATACTYTDLLRPRHALG